MVYGFTHPQVLTDQKISELGHFLLKMMSKFQNVALFQLHIKLDIMCDMQTIDFKLKGVSSKPSGKCIVAPNFCFLRATFFFFFFL